MNHQPLLDRLAALPLLASVPPSELEWLIARGEEHTYAAGTILREIGAAVDEMAILLAGRVAIDMPRGGGWRRVLEVGPGYVVGPIPFSRFHGAPGKLIVEEDMTALVLQRSHFADLVRECPGLIAALVHHMLDRTRQFHTVKLQDERMQSLGRLAAGLAHELNNPAAAATRSAQTLCALLDEAERASRAVAAAGLSEAQLAAVDTVRTACAGDPPERSALEAADREDDIAEWLTRHGLDPLAADALAASDVTLGNLERLADTIPSAALGAVIQWVASGAAARGVARQIESATGRVHDLVRAVKGFTFMDREAVPEEIDIARGLADTLAMLESKSRGKAVAVRLETAEDLPRVYGFGSEINQVWEKLIDNAIDAAGTEGSVTVTATGRGDAVVVRVMDDGPGIPEEHRARVFDPFFTTKPVGRGTGLGLDLARRVVELHHGDVEFTSQPGKTVFRVRLPVTGVEAARGVPRGPDGSG